MQHIPALRVAGRVNKRSGIVTSCGLKWRPQQLKAVNDVNLQNHCVYEFRRGTSSSDCHAVGMNQSDTALTHRDRPAGDTNTHFFWTSWQTAVGFSVAAAGSGRMLYANTLVKCPSSPQPDGVCMLLSRCVPLTLCEIADLFSNTSLSGGCLRISTQSTQTHCAECKQYVCVCVRVCACVSVRVCVCVSSLQWLLSIYPKVQSKKLFKVRLNSNALQGNHNIQYICSVCVFVCACCKNWQNSIFLILWWIL